MSTDQSVAQDALIAVIRAAGRLSRQIGAFLEAYGVTTAQYNVLRILRGAGGHLPIMTIRDRMMTPEPSITRLVDRLEAKGLVERHRQTDDRRCVECRLTPSGLALVEELDGPVDELDQRLMAGLTASQQSVLVQLAERVGTDGD